MKSPLLSILICLFIFHVAYAESEIDYFPLAEGNYWVYQDQIEIQDIDGEFEVETKHTGENVKVKGINAQSTLKVLSVEDIGNFKVAKMQEEDFQGVKTFHYVIKNGKEIYRLNDENDLKQAIAKDKLAIYSLEYVSSLQVGSKWGDPNDLKRKDKMYFRYVEKTEDITVPAGTFKDCFKIIYNTLPDETIQWFYPNVGIVRLEYRHHGTIINWISELKEQDITHQHKNMPTGEEVVGEIYESFSPD
jgi:hypothetical protein